MRGCVRSGVWGVDSPALGGSAWGARIHLARWLTGWVARRWPVTTAALVVGAATWWMTSIGVWVIPAAASIPALVVWLWVGFAPLSYERLVAGPSRRRAWCSRFTRDWPTVAREVGFSRQRTAASGVLEWVAPELVTVRAFGPVLEITVRLSGHTLVEVDKAAERLTTHVGATSSRTRLTDGSTIVVSLVMQNALADATTSTGPSSSSANEPVVGVLLGRTQEAKPWQLGVRGRHTLVVGASGSGKGSILWGVCGGLAPWVARDVVRLWGVDLKRGVEIGMGRGLFSTVAYNPADAVALLKQLLAVIDERAPAMVGHSRLHEPTPGDPLHVLVIDELAVLTAYGEPASCREAERLLGEVLTQGRALGVVVLACVQDPRKEVVGLRNLFTQTIALRLNSASEVTMVLGDGRATVAPAHRISPEAPGTAWVVEEDGSVLMVRADYWPDELIQQVAHDFPAPNQLELNALPPVDPSSVAENPYGTVSGGGIVGWACSA